MLFPARGLTSAHLCVNTLFPQLDNFLMAPGKKCFQHAQPVSLIQPIESLNRFSSLSNDSESEPEHSRVSAPLVTGSEPPKPDTFFQITETIITAFLS